GKGSATPTKPHHTPSPHEQHSPHHDPSSPSHPTTTNEPILHTPTETPTKTPTIRRYTRRAIRISQSKALSPTVDEHTSFLRDERQGEAFPTVSSLDARHDRENINKTFALPHESSPRVTSLDADEGKPTQEDAPIKGGIMEIGEEVGAEKSTELGSNNTEEMVNVLSSMEAANILKSIVAAASVSPAAGVSTAGVPTVSGSFPTVSAIFTTSSVVTPYTRRPRGITIGEQATLKEGANGVLHAVLRSHAGWKTKHFRGMTLEEIKKKFIPGEGSGTPTEPHHTPSLEAQQSSPTALSSLSLPPATTATIPTSTPTEIPTLRQYSRRARIAYRGKSFGLSNPYSPSSVSPKGRSFNGSFNQDLEISGLKARFKFLKDKDKGSVEPTQEDALIKRGIMEIEEEVRAKKSTELGSNDTEDMVNVLSSIKAANILTSGVATASVSPAAGVSATGVPTISRHFPTGSAIFTTASVVTPYTRRPREITIGSAQHMRSPIIRAKDKGKQKVVEYERLSEQLTRDSEIARLHVEEELKMMIEGLDRSNEVIVKHLQEYEQVKAELTVREKLELINELTFRGMTLEEIKEKIIPVWKQFEDFVPMSSKDEAERVKRKGLKLDQGSSKRMKTFEDVSEEDLKGMMQLVPLEEVYDEALQATKDKEKELWVELKRLFEPDFEDQLWIHNQALMHDPLEWKLYDTCGVHHVFTKDQEIFMLVEKDYPLRKGLDTVMICNKLKTVQDEELIEASFPDEHLILET
nr:hypothetical protein [Tanacetum cinerariifolium]